jgi:tRNA pseudouridine55 synthase
MQDSPAQLPRAGGVLLVDKPEGPTSHDVVDRVRRTLAERRIGHTGTLDPFASGLIVLCLGPATRLAEYLSGMDKEYLATVRLGQRTATHDRDGAVVSESDEWRGLSTDAISRALADLTGALRQLPPEFSAKKVGGEPAYRKARRGEAVELAAVDVTVHELELLEALLPLVRVRVSCSSGTYVRALARDLGEALAVGAHLTELRRTRVGPFRVEKAAPPSELEDADALLRRILEPARALAHMPAVSVNEVDAARLAQGQEVPTSGVDVPEGLPLAVLRRGALVAVATSVEGRLRPRKVFAGWRDP